MFYRTYIRQINKMNHWIYTDTEARYFHSVVNSKSTARPENIRPNFVKSLRHFQFTRNVRLFPEVEFFDETGPSLVNAYFTRREKFRGKIRSLLGSICDLPSAQFSKKLSRTHEEWNRRAAKNSAFNYRSNARFRGAAV